MKALLGGFGGEGVRYCGRRYLLTPKYGTKYWRRVDICQELLAATMVCISTRRLHRHGFDLVV